MKKFLWILFLASLPVSVKAASLESYNILDASYTITSDPLVKISSCNPGTILMYVDVSSPSANGTLKIYDSSGAASSQVANIDLGARGFYKYEVRFSSGLTYATTNNGSGFTITFKRPR